MKKLLILSFLALGYQSASAQLVTESFGTGANAFTMDFVTIGNPGNQPGGLSGRGAVSYVFNIGKYEISREMIEKANISASLNITLADYSTYTGNGNKKPAGGINWPEAAKFANYLNTASSSSLAYKFDVSGNFQLWSPADPGYDPANGYRNKLAKFFIPSKDEWYKAAYYDPTKTEGEYWKFANRMDNKPNAVAQGTMQGTAVYDGQLGPADIDNAGGLSFYGTMAQDGNVYEWLETSFHTDSNNWAGDSHAILSGSWGKYAEIGGLGAGFWDGRWPNEEPGDYGFRVAMIPEPSALSFLAVGLGALAMMRRRRS